MSMRITAGEAFVDGRHVADIELSEEWVEQAVPIPIPGTNRIDYKDLSHRGPAHVRFGSVTDAGLRSRLETLIEFASADVERKRAIRGAGQRSIAVDVAVDDGRNLIGARVEPPFVGLTSVEATLFPVSLPE